MKLTKFLRLDFLPQSANLGLLLLRVAFFHAHKAVLKGPASGELAFIYLATYLTLFVAGGGRFSLDAKMGGKA